MPRGKAKRSFAPPKKPITIVEEKEDFRDHIDSTKVSAHLFCSICQEIFKHPVRAPCGHSYCQACILQWLQNSRTCPDDRKKLNRGDLHHDFILENIIGDQKVACPFRKYGCSLVTPLSILASHFKTCQFNTDNLPKFLKVSLESYASSQSTNENLDDSNIQEAGEDGTSPLKYIPLKMRMYLKGGETREGLVKAFSNEESQYEKLLKMFKTDEN